MDDHAAHYGFVISRLKQLPMGRPRVLDFGCGAGRVIATARAAGLDVVGADAYSGKWAWRLDAADPGARDHISQIVDGRLPYPDDSFDCVYANMVFEHIPWSQVPGALREISRVLKPGGYFLALFPTAEIWFEGHLGLYFPHWMSRWPKLQSAYLRACHRIGLGYFGKSMSAATWADKKQRQMTDSVFYHSASSVMKQWAAAFGNVPESLATEYIRFRMGLGGRARFLDRALEFVCHKRAAHVLLTTKQARR
jgi:SAM-dependent methyltransferase